MDIANNLAQVKLRIAKACAACGRDPGGIALVAVSKKKPIASILSALAACQNAFGENYLQEALDKIKLAGLEPAAKDIVWHFLGSIQTNKTKKIAENFSWVHGISRSLDARRLNSQRPLCLPPLNVCVQVNISEEDSKSGMSVEAVADFLPIFDSLERLKLRGLMVIPSFTEDKVAQARMYQKVQMLYNGLLADGWPIDTLSMGMSHDLETAIKYGSTMVRVGQAIFGAR